ncbi:NUDIX hydrolase [Methylomonas rivi]|uniref:GDP-mannose pyrophosphatase n=1 Tax=Methylomonas rivi TaxID=2952226 RepID=A0ABT1U0N7_9GAMM|nr:NUDIX hydrolase [Methylomonas sp. WSC-6]MCQ8127397.1 NUDIX hydrolase [Methylomonas sp. WSC-6]
MVKDFRSSIPPQITLLSRSVVFENTVFSVFADHIADNSGHQVERYLSVLPKYLVDDSIAGVAVIPVANERIGLIRIFRHPVGRWSWEAIKGHVEPDENIQAAAVRELQEEAGFSVLPDALLDLGFTAPEAGVIKARTRLFAVDVEQSAARTVAGELGHGEMVFYSRGEIEMLIAEGEIEDASTLVLLFKYWFQQHERP